MNDNRPVVDWSYRHYRDGLFTVITIAEDQNGEPTVVYRSCSTKDVRVCPMSAWFERVFVDGQEVNAFERMQRFIGTDNHVIPLFMGLHGHVHSQLGADFKYPNNEAINNVEDNVIRIVRNDIWRSLPSMDERTFRPIKLATIKAFVTSPTHGN